MYTKIILLSLMLVGCQSKVEQDIEQDKNGCIHFTHHDELGRPVKYYRCPSEDEKQPNKQQENISHIIPLPKMDTK